jgi:hypothetical protein
MTRYAYIYIILFEKKKIIKKNNKTWNKNVKTNYYQWSLTLSWLVGLHQPSNPSFKGDLGGGFATCEFIQTYTCKDKRRMCCLISASEGGSLTRDASLTKADLALSSYKSICFCQDNEDCKNHLTHRAVPENITVVIRIVDEDMM